MENFEALLSLALKCEFSWICFYIKISRLDRYMNEQDSRLVLIKFQESEINETELLKNQNS